MPWPLVNCCNYSRETVPWPLVTCCNYSRETLPWPLVTCCNYSRETVPFSGMYELEQVLIMGGKLTGLLFIELEEGGRVITAISNTPYASSLKRRLLEERLYKFLIFRKTTVQTFDFYNNDWKNR